MNTKPDSAFHGMSMRPLDALSNIEDLLAGAEVCLCSGNKETQDVGTHLIELARKYANEARIQGGVA